MDKYVINKVIFHKKDYVDLLMLADEQESMIDRYLERGDMFVMESAVDHSPIAVAVVTFEGDGTYELKNLAVKPDVQRKGYGRQMVEYIWEYYKERCSEMSVGTGDSTSTIEFYRSCGFEYSHRIPGFFTRNYDHPIYEDGVLLEDMIYLKRYRKR